MALLENLFSPGTVERLGWMLVHFLWQATAVAVLLAVLLRLLRRTSANLRYAVACGALALMVMLPLVTMQLVEVAGPVAEAGPPPETAPPAAVEPLPVTIRTVDNLPPLAAVSALETADLTVPVPWPERVTAALESAFPYVVLGWLVGVFGLSAWHLGGWTQLHRLKRRMTRRAGAALRETLDELAARLGVHRAVALLESALVEVPTVVGWLRPVVLLPASALTGLSPDQLRAILAHELAHIRRYDYLANLLQTAVEILGFYHPALWWVSHRIRVERENCCDDLAVRICGDSLQYARALTSMEEIRHSRSDLAVAATGGSLMARIARLLGRPVVDDRRFAWLPGLIALLLVAGIVIPAALVFAAPDTPRVPPPVAENIDSEPNMAEADAPNASSGQVLQTTAEAPQDGGDKAQVLVGFTIAKALTAATVDRETMLLIGAALAVEKPQAATEIARADPKHDATLGEVLRRYVAGQLLSAETGQALLDLLQGRGFLEVQSTPKILTADGREAEMRIGSQEVIPPSLQHNGDIAEAAPAKIECGIRIKATPHVTPDENVRLELAVSVTEPIPQAQPGDPPVFRTREIASTLVVPDNQYGSLLAESSSDANAPDWDPESLLILFKTTITRPAPIPESTPSAPAGPLTPHPRQVLLDARVLAVERAELQSLGLTNGYPTVGLSDFDNARNSQTRAPQPGYYLPSQKLTDDWMARLDRLLFTKRAEIVTHPQMVIPDGRRVQLRYVENKWSMTMVPETSDVFFRTELTRNEPGTVMTITPYPMDGNTVLLRIGGEIRESIPRNGGSDPPIVTRRWMKNTVTIQHGGTAAVTGLNTNLVGQDGQSTKDIAVFVTVSVVSETGALSQPSPTISQKTHTQTRPEISETRYVRLNHQTPQRVKDGLPSEYKKYVRIGDSGTPDLDYSGRLLMITAPAVSADTIVQMVRRLDAPPPQVLLDARVVEVEHENLARLGVKWDRPTAHTGSFNSSWPKSIQVGQSPDSTFTDSLMRILNRLESAHQVRLISNPQLVIQDGRQAQLRTIMGEWFMMSAPDPNAFITRAQLERLPSAAILSMVPRIGDNNAITLEMSISISDSFPKGAAIDLPLDTLPRTRNRITIQNGGTVAVAGLTTDPGKQGEQPTKDIAVFVTARLIPQANQPLPPAPRPRDKVQRTPSVNESQPVRPIVETMTKGREVPPGQVLFDVHSIVVERDDRLRLPVEWDRQILEVFPAASARAVFPSIQAGNAGNQAATESLFTTLRQLEGGDKVEFLSHSQVLEENGQPSQVTVRTGEWYLMGQGHSDVNLSITPRIVSEGDIMLDTTVEIRDSATVDRSDKAQITIRRAPDRTYALKNGGTLVLAGYDRNDGNRAREIVILVTATFVPETGMIHQSAPVGPRRPPTGALQSDRPSSGAPRATSTSANQVFFDARVVAMAPRDLLSLGVEWSFPPIRAGQTRAGVDWHKGIQIGSLPDWTSTNSLMARLNQLAGAKQARIMDNPQVISRNGRPAELLSFGEEWANYGDEQSAQQALRDREECKKALSGASLSITPNVGDGNDLTLDVAVEVGQGIATESDGAPSRDSPPNSPLPTRRPARNTISMQNGGTMVIAGLTANSTGQKGQSSKYLVVFVTTGLVESSSPPTALRPAQMSGVDRIAELEADLIAAGKTPAPEEKKLRESYVQELARKRLDPEASPHESSSMSLPPGRPVTPMRPSITTTFARIGLLDALTRISRHFDVKMAVAPEVGAQPITVELLDASVETAIQQVLKGTPYGFKWVGEGESAAYVVFPLINVTFEGVELRQALEDIATMAEVPIILDPNVQGKVSVKLENASLDQALKMVLAGTPYVHKRVDNYYLVADTSTAGSRPIEKTHDSRAWTIMRQWNCPPLLLGLTQRFGKVLEPARRNDPAWQNTRDGGTLRVKVEVEGGEVGEVVIGLFADARWSQEPVAVRRVAGSGVHALTGLPAGRFQIGAMIGEVPIPVALGTHRTWPEPVEIWRDHVATAEVLVSEAFQKHASGYYNDEVAADQLGRWGNLDESNLLQGQLTGPNGQPIRFGQIQIREHNPGARGGIAAPDRGTDERGFYRYDRMAWPYRVTALWREPLPSLFGHRYQVTSLGRVLEGSQRVDFRFDPFPQGTARLAGRVLDEDGRPVEGFFIRLLTLSWDDLRRSEPLDGGFHTYTGYDIPFLSPDGRFELSGLPAGTACAHVIPFEIKRYERRDFTDVTLAAGQTTNLDFRLSGKQVFYGRVLFEDGTPAVVRPRPWKEAVTRILLTTGGRAGVSSEVDAEGYFTLYLDAMPGSSRLRIHVPTDQEHRWETAGEFPFEKLSRDKSQAGVVMVKRPRPTPTLPPELRQGGPLPPEWRLDYREHDGTDRRKKTHVVLEARLAPAAARENNPPSQERFEIYRPDGKQVMTFGPRSMIILDDAQPHTLICTPDEDREPGDWRITHGPYTLDLTQPGWYTLIMDLGVASDSLHRQ